MSERLMLASLVISVSRGSVDQQPAATVGADARCRYCGGTLGLHAGADGDCALCCVVRGLDRPKIDEEASLVWLPEISQASLVGLVREMHARLRAAGEGLHGEHGLAGASPEIAAVRYTGQALAGRAGTAAANIGVSRPSELARALSRVSDAAYARRDRLLGALRVMPAGRFFAGGRDVYPAIVSSWRAAPGDGAARRAA